MPEMLMRSTYKLTSTSLLCTAGSLAHLLHTKKTIGACFVPAVCPERTGNSPSSPQDIQACRLYMARMGKLCCFAASPLGFRGITHLLLAHTFSKLISQPFANRLETKDSLISVPGDKCEKTAGKSSSGNVANDMNTMSALSSRAQSEWDATVISVTFKTQTQWFSGVIELCNDKKRIRLVTAK